MPPHRWTSLEELEDLVGHNINLPPLGASQLGFHIRDRSVRTGSATSTPIKAKAMPKRTRSSKRSGARTPARSFRRRRTTTRSRKRFSEIHTFKGIVNAGILSGIPAATSTHLGGQYVFQLSDFPIITGSLGNSFDFVRLNKCKLEFMPRYNMQSAPNTQAGTTGAFQQTFLTGLDEIPITHATPLTSAPTWSSQGDEDAGITESKAYDHVRITPDYLRGMQSSKETEIYKKHVVNFIPTYYTWAVNNASQADAILSNGVYSANKKKWVNLNYLSQDTGAEVQSLGPDFYGPMYSFGNSQPASSTQQFYDVKLHYSVSFRRLKGF